MRILVWALLLFAVGTTIYELFNDHPGEESPVEDQLAYYKKIWGSACLGKAALYFVAGLLSMMMKALE